jgi:uncharacterized membrane protein (UPF0127 family)
MRKLEVRGEKGLVCVAETAENPWTRGWGLLGRRGLPEGQGLWIRPCKSVHTFFMRFTIDVLYLTREGEVCKASPRVRPFRFSSGGKKAHSVLELQAGTLEKQGIHIGERLVVTAVGELEAGEVLAAVGSKEA